MSWVMVKKSWCQKHESLPPTEIKNNKPDVSVTLFSKSIAYLYKMPIIHCIITESQRTEKDHWTLGRTSWKSLHLFSQRRLLTPQLSSFTFSLNDHEQAYLISLWLIFLSAIINMKECTSRVIMMIKLICMKYKNANIE